MKSLKEIIQNLEKLVEDQKRYEQGGLIFYNRNPVIEETLEYLRSESIMAEELFTALSDLVACDGDFSHMKFGGMFDLVTDDEDYNKAVDVLKKYHSSIE